MLDSRLRGNDKVRQGMTRLFEIAIMESPWAMLFCLRARRPRSHGKVSDELYDSDREK